MPRLADEIFPYTTDAIGAAFTRACQLLGFNSDDAPVEKRLHFHDLRHDGVSSLFEIGWNIPHVAAVSGHGRRPQSRSRVLNHKQGACRAGGAQSEASPNGHCKSQSIDASLHRPKPSGVTAQWIDYTFCLVGHEEESVHSRMPRLPRRSNRPSSIRPDNFTDFTPPAPSR